MLLPLKYLKKEHFIHNLPQISTRQWRRQEEEYSIQQSISYFKFTSHWLYGIKWSVQVQEHQVTTPRLQFRTPALMHTCTDTHTYKKENHFSPSDVWPVRWPPDLQWPNPQWNKPNLLLMDPLNMPIDWGCIFQLVVMDWIYMKEREKVEGEIKKREVTQGVLMSCWDSTP